MGPNGNGRQAAPGFDGWWKSHGFAGGYTPEPNAVLEAVMADKELRAVERVQAWIMRHSTGNHADALLDQPGGRNLTMVHCAKTLGISKPTILDILWDLEDRQDIALQGRSAIYRIFRGCRCWACEERRELASRNTEKRSQVRDVPNLDPSDGEEDYTSEPSLSSGRPTQLSLFLLYKDKRFQTFYSSEWIPKRPDRAEEIKRIERERAELQRKRSELFAREEKLLKEAYAEYQRRREEKESVKQSPTPSAKPKAELKDLVVRLARERGIRDLPRPELLARIEANLNGAPLERLEEHVRDKWKKFQALGFLANLAEVVGRLWAEDAHEQQQREVERKAAERELEEFRASVLRRLAEVPAKELDRLRAAMRRDLPGGESLPEESIDQLIYDDLERARAC